MKYSLELKVALISVILIIIFMFYLYFFSPDIEKYIKNVDKLPSINDIKNNFKTGDLLFTSGNNYGSKTIKWATSSYWSHLAIVIVLSPENNNGKKEILLWECDAGQGARKGARLISLEQKLSRYKGSNIGAWKEYIGKKEIDFEKLFKFINTYTNKIELQDRIYSYIFSRYGPKSLYEKVKNKNKWYCSELVARTYQYLGILNEKINPCSVSPEDFFDFNNKDRLQIKKLFNNNIIFKN